MNKYLVTLHEDAGDKFVNHFLCQADDPDHAEEQALNAYPSGEIINVSELRDMKPTYPRQLHTFPKDEFKNPDGPLTAWVYNGIADPVEPYANYIIEWLNDGKGNYMLVIENDSFISDNLDDLEPRLFAWMEGEGVVANATGKEDA